MVLFIIRIVIACIIFICAGITVVLVIKQSANSDGAQALSGGSDSRDAYGAQSSASRKERRLKLLTYVCAGVIAVCSLAFVIINAIVA